jgi:Uma2 family endonuclease
MPATLTERPPAPPVQYPPRKRWSRAEYQKAEAAGVFDQQNLELIEGEIIDKKMSKNRPHVNAAALLIAWLLQVFGTRRVNFEAPIDVAPEDNPTNQPEPDMIVLRQEYVDSGAYRASTPQPRDLALVVEIADTSLAFDLTTKAALYARAGIAEYWVLDILGRRLLVHRQPEGGQYAAVTSYSQDESVAPAAAPHSSLAISSLFPD